MPPIPPPCPASVCRRECIYWPNFTYSAEARQAGFCSYWARLNKKSDKHLAMAQRRRIIIMEYWLLGCISNHEAAAAEELTREALHLAEQHCEELHNTG